MAPASVHCKNKGLVREKAPWAGTLVNKFLIRDLPPTCQVYIHENKPGKYTKDLGSVCFGEANRDASPSGANQNLPEPAHRNFR